MAIRRITGNCSTAQAESKSNNSDYEKTNRSNGFVFNNLTGALNPQRTDARYSAVGVYLKYEYGENRVEWYYKKQHYNFE